MPPRAHQFRAGRDPRGMWLCPLGAVRQGADQDLQGQEGPEIQENVGTHVLAKKKRPEPSTVLAAQGRPQPGRTEPLPLCV